MHCNVMQIRVSLLKPTTFFAFAFKPLPRVFIASTSLRLAASINCFSASSTAQHSRKPSVSFGYSNTCCDVYLLESIVHFIHKQVMCEAMTMVLDQNFNRNTVRYSKKSFLFICCGRKRSRFQPCTNTVRIQSVF